MENKKNNKDILVTIVSLAYNHESYIRQCLEGFVMQKTNFTFEVLIHDDASTDGTADIIREYELKYPDIIKPIYQKENQYSKGISIGRTFLYPNAKGKYIAECEGDDYWTDPYKLQKQVDFLEANSEYSMCFANAIEHWEDGMKEDKCFSNVEDRDYTGVEIYENWIVPTASVLYRKEIVFSERYKKIKSNKNFIFGDIVLFLTCAEFGKLRGMSDVVSVYRRHEGGVTINKSNDWSKKYAIHQLAIYNVFGDRYKKYAISIPTQLFVYSIFSKKLPIQISLLCCSLKISFWGTIVVIFSTIVKIIKFYEH